MENNIENLISSTINNLKEVLDIDTVIGRPIKISDIVTIVPICKMIMGLISGGSDSGRDKTKRAKVENYAGGSGTGITYTPIGVLYVVADKVGYIPLGENIPYYDIVNSLENVITKVLDKMEKNNGKNNKK